MARKMFEKAGLMAQQYHALLQDPARAAELLEDLTRNDAVSTDLKVVFGEGDSATTAEKMYFPTEPGVAVAGREGDPRDVANAIVFLASDASAYINGESIEINGGLYFV